MGKVMKRDCPPAFRWLKVGARADYHSVIGGPVTLPGCTVTEVPFPIPGLTSRVEDRWCCFVDKKRGWVACDALTPSPAEGKLRKGGQNLSYQITERPPDPPPMKPKRSRWP